MGKRIEPQLLVAFRRRLEHTEIPKLHLIRKVVAVDSRFLVDQITACISGIAFSICRTQPAAGRDNLQHLRKMIEKSELHQHPIRETLML